MTRFSQEQRDAIAVDRLGEDACITAGPGSGKTTVLVERFRQLVVERGVPPGRILAITFTEKAAANMRERLSRELSGLLDTANVSTVHGFCYRLIREHAIEAGVDPGASILEEGKGVLLRKRCLEQALDQCMAEQPTAMRRLIRSLGSDVSGLTEAYDAIRSAGASLRELHAHPVPSSAAARAEVDRLMGDVRALPLKPHHRAKVASLFIWHERLQQCADVEELGRHLQSDVFDLRSVRDTGLTAAVNGIREAQKELAADCATTRYARERRTLLSVLERFEDLYVREKRSRGWLDFSDLEFYAVRLLETHESIRRKLREHYRQIMMDEFQDTNGQQERLMELLRAPDRFYAVGDINQSIFGFRHTTPEVFERYRGEVERGGKHLVELVENWRSRPEILLAVETVLASKDGIVPRPLVAAKVRPAKRIPSVEVIAVEQPDEVEGTPIEAKWIAQRIRELHGTLPLESGKATYRDMAVLVRNSVVFPDFAQAFEAAGIPLDQSRRKGFLETREARDLLHLLRVIANPRDEVSLAVVLRSPLVALSDESILRLETVSSNLGDALNKVSAEGLAQFEERDRERLQHFLQQLPKLRAEQPNRALDRLLWQALDDAAYPYEPNTDAGRNLEKFLEMARAATGSLQEFLDELELLREVDTSEPETPLEAVRDAVRMMTAHSAKGLEFPIVFVASMNKGTRIDSPPFSFTPEVGLGTNWRSGDEPKGQADAYHAANRKTTAAREREEANRLLYVAMTRAEEHLVLSYSTAARPFMNWAQYVRDTIVKPSEAPQDRPTVVPVRHPDGREFAVRLLRTARAPLADQTSFAFAAYGGALQLPRPACPEQYDSAVTVTALSTFAACPRRYYLAHYLGWEQRPPVRLAEYMADSEPSASPASELGREVHRLLADANAKVSPLARTLARVFDEHPLAERARRATRTEREWGFHFAVDDVIVSGQIDLWFVEDGRVVLVDYKTNKIDAADVAEFAQDYETQMQLYALCLQRAAGLPVAEAYLHFLRPGVLHPVTPDPEAAIRAVRALAHQQEQGKFPLHVAGHCRGCSFYQNLCPADLKAPPPEGQ